MTCENCVLCGRPIDASKEAAHYPCSWSCPEPLRTLRERRPDDPVCLDCLPDVFKRGNAHWRPILSHADLPKAGDPLPPNVVCRPAPGPTCVGPAEDGWKGLGGPRCGAEATHRTPDGPRCEACARRLAEAAHAPDTLLGLLIRKREGVTLAPVETLLERWRIQ